MSGLSIFFPFSYHSFCTSVSKSWQNCWRGPRRLGEGQRARPMRGGDGGDPSASLGVAHRPRSARLHRGDRRPIPLRCAPRPILGRCGPIPQAPRLTDRTTRTERAKGAAPTHPSPSNSPLAPATTRRAMRARRAEPPLPYSESERARRVTRNPRLVTLRLLCLAEILA